MRLRGFVLALGLLAILVSVKATGQDQSLDAAIEQSRSGGSSRELQAQANAQPPATEDKHELAIFYHKRGMANHRLGNYSNAVSDLRLALENNQPKRPTPDEWGARFRIQNDLGNAYEARSDWFSAIDLWNTMAQDYQKSDLVHYHFSQLRLMRSYAVLGQWADAEKARQAADATLPRLRNPPARWARLEFIILNQHDQWSAQFFARQGNYTEAERRYRASLEAAEKYLQDAQARYAKGDQQLRTAVTNVRTAKIELADILSTQGKYAEAEAYAREGLEDTLALYAFNTTPVAYALGVVAWTRLQQGDLVSAEKYRRHALAAVEGSGVPTHSTDLAARRGNLADAYLVQGRWNDALKLYQERDRGLRSDEAQFKRIGSGVLGWAYTLHKAGQSPAAGRMAGAIAEAVAKRAVPDRWLIARAQGVLGMALAAEGKMAEALKAYRESIPELIRRDQDASAENTGLWRAFWQRAILEGYLELLARLQTSGETVPGTDLADESFRIADIARGSSVQEAINATAARAQLPDKSLAELARKEQDALNRITALNRVLSGLAAAPADERATRILSDVRAEIERLRKERSTLRADIRNRFPEYAELIDPRPASISDVRKVLAPGEVVVSIYLGESQSYVWTIAAGGKATFRVVPIKRQEVEGDVRELRKAVDLVESNVAQIRPFDLARAHKLYRAYLEADEALWKGAQVLNVIPHGALGQLPFALLVTAQSQQLAAGAQSAYREVPWLVRRVAIAQLPSASAFAALRRSPAGKAGRQAFIGFGDPMFMADAPAGANRAVVRNLTVRKIADSTEQRIDAIAHGNQPQAAAVPTPMLAQAFLQLSALPDTNDELRQLAVTFKTDVARDVFVNRRATEKNVKLTKLDNTRVIAFATHGVGPGELTGLDQPALVLSNPALTGDSGNDGFLTMEEVLALKLDADWVVLSACNTGSSDGRANEAVSGLGRAFFYAGARSLLVSNWAVETTSAKMLTTELFKRQAENPQLTRAEALRQSMLSLMGKSATGAANFSYAHPAFWAPFSLVGDGGR